MSTDQELERLANDRLPPGSRIWTTHFFSHFYSSEGERERFRAELNANGFGPAIGSDEEVSGNGYWHHWAFTELLAEPAVLEQADERARQVAATSGVRYEGWKVQREEFDQYDSPRLAADA
jgi:hypothetical protein